MRLTKQIARTAISVAILAGAALARQAAVSPAQSGEASARAVVTIRPKAPLLLNGLRTSLRSLPRQVRALYRGVPADRRVVRIVSEDETREGWVRLTEVVDRLRSAGIDRVGLAPAPRPTQDVVVRVDVESRLYVDGTEVERSALAGRVRAAFAGRQGIEHGIRLEASRDVPYDVFLSVVNALHEAGFDSIGLRVGDGDP